MLRTGCLALTAHDAGRGKCTAGTPAVFVARLGEVAVHLIDVHHGEDLRDVDARGTARRAVVAGCAGNVGKR